MTVELEHRRHDADLVLSAIRLGWSVAEVRGRNRPFGPTGVTVTLPPRVDDPLPLRVQRSPTEWHFDAHVQARLSAISDTQACGYQLGRGLAECYWALDPDAPSGWDSWAFLFNELRCSELTRLAGRLSDYLEGFAASAIAGSLEVWKLLAADDDWHRQPTVEADLYQQTRNWYELVILHQDPTQLVKPYQVLRSWRVILKAARAYFPQLVLSAIGVGLLLGFVKAASQKHPLGWVEALLSLVSAAGLSAAGLTAKLKNEAQALSIRLRQDAYTDLIAASITTVPNPPSKRHARSRQTIVETAVRNRDLTPSTPLG